MKHNYFTKLFTLLLIILVLFQSCKKEEKVAPELPPESAFVTDFSDFNTTQKNKTNYNHASGKVLFWNLVIAVKLAVPTLSYVEAVKNHEPVYQDDNTWLWSYKFGTDYTAKLYGKIQDDVSNNDSVEWKMYITKTGSYTDFLWYYGKSAVSMTGGYWVLFDAPNIGDHVAAELLKITWTTNNDSVGHIKYQNIKAGDAEEGGYIEYGNDNGYEQLYNTFYNIYNKGQDNLTSIEWDKATKAGRIKDKKHFSDELWHCWDKDYENIDCE